MVYFLEPQSPTAGMSDKGFSFSRSGRDLNPDQQQRLSRKNRGAVNSNRTPTTTSREDAHGWRQVVHNLTGSRQDEHVQPAHGLRLGFATGDVDCVSSNKQGDSSSGDGDGKSPLYIETSKLTPSTSGAMIRGP